MNASDPNARRPTLFVSHGAPTLVIEDGPAHRFLAGLGNELARPKAVLMISAHYEAPALTVTTGEAPETIHDFRGFPRELYEIGYPAPGDPGLAADIVALLNEAGLPAQGDPKRGFDHGAWVPMMLMYPQADVPLVQLSIDPRRGAAYHHALGEALRPLRERGVLIAGSGGATHNLRYFSGARHDDPAPDWVAAFGDWLTDAVVHGRRDDLVHYRERGPHAAHNHPSEEHYLPLLTALGASEPGETGRRLHTSTTYGILRMDSFLFGGVES